MDCTERIQHPRNCIDSVMSHKKSIGVLFKETERTKVLNCFANIHFVVIKVIHHSNQTEATH